VGQRGRREWHLPPNSSALASLDSSRAFALTVSGAEAQLAVYDLNGALLSGGLYPLTTTISLTDPLNSVEGGTASLTMASNHDDSLVFVSGDRGILVVPVP
jgi:hypothetical protein